VFLEVNSQGQFLFAEGLSGRSLATPFAEFLRAQSYRGTGMSGQIPESAM
jgi:hypothetical protein